MGDSARRPIGTDDFFRLRLVDGPQISPDGTRVAYTVAELDRVRDAMVSSVWLEDRHVRGHSPRWSPDGLRIAFLGNRGQHDQVLLWDPLTGAARELTRLPDGASQPAWSPDSRLIACISVGRVWVVPVDKPPGSMGAVSGADQHAKLPQWSPDGGRIAYVVPGPDGCSAEIWLTSPTGGPQRLLAFGGPVLALAWSPDGRSLAWVGHNQANAQGVNFGVWSAPAQGGAARNLTAGFDRSIGLVVRADDGRGSDVPLRWVAASGEWRLYFGYPEGGSSHVAWISSDGQIHTAISGGRAVLSFDVAADADVLAFSASDATHPGDIFVASRDGAAEKRTTDVNAAWLGEVELAGLEDLGFNADDGQRIDAWLLRPPAGSKSSGGLPPVVHSIHGGPHYSIGRRFYFEFQRLAAMGYGVVFGNPRGSQGYGESFATCIRRAWGDRDYRDLMQMTDAALARGGIDPQRMAVTGVSYGGFMTHWIIGRNQRFGAAISENGISELVSNFAHSAGKAFWTWHMDGPPEQARARYEALSPIARVDDMRTPLLMIHAERDETVNILQSEQLHAALQARGRTSTLERIPGEGHLMNLVGRPSSRLKRATAVDAWLARWLSQ